MGWIEDTGRHEGHVKVVFADGQLGGGVMKSGGLSVDGPDGLAQHDADDDYALRPPAAVVGWRIACNHVPAYVPDEDLARYPHHRLERWLSPVVWHRVYSPGEEDLVEHRVYASLDDKGSVYLMDRAEVDEQLEQLLLAEWRAHIEPEDHEHSIRAAVAAITTAQQQLDLEVAAARTAGLSWGDIGRAAGMTRQGALSRWGSPA